MKSNILRQYGRKASISGCVAIIGLLTSAGCADIQDDFHYTRGVEPSNVDDYVRFRTTYYFRVFDLCDKRSQLPTAPPRADLFMAKNSVGEAPQKDAIYRFRMTGKASAQFSTVHFESGTLRASEIDPFGADVSYDDETRQFSVRSPGATQADADRARRIRTVRQLRDLMDKMPEGQAKVQAEAQLVQALQGLSVTPAFPTAMIQAELAQVAINAVAQAQEYNQALARYEFARPALLADMDLPTKKTTAEGLTAANKKIDAVAIEARNLVEELSNGLDKSQTALGGLDSAAKTDPEKAALATLRGAVGGIRARFAAASRMLLDQASIHTGRAPLAAGRSTMPTSCSEGVGPQRGFQILGPEGLRTFDQDERLVMAMSSDAKPLIGLLQELSSRVLGNKVNPAERLLPIAQEQAGLNAARYELVSADGSLDTVPAAKALLDAAAAKLKGN